MKKTITTITLAIVMTFTATATFADPGILVSDKSAPTTSCSSDTAREGILVGDFASIIYSLVGIIIGDKQAPCSQNKDGIIISD